MFEDLIKEKEKVKPLNPELHLYCMRCGYTLDGPHEISICPICGTYLVSIEK